MATITRIEPQKRRPNRRNVFIDGELAFGCNVNVVARFRLRQGMAIDGSLRRRIEDGEVRQEAFDEAMKLIRRRMHSEREVRLKLAGREYGSRVIEAVVANLKRLGYVNDEKFAAQRAAGSARVKKLGRARAVQELRKAGIAPALAERSAREVYKEVDSRQSALELARTRARSMSRLDRVTARRRLAGFLQRRGFDYETVQYAVQQALEARPGTSGDVV
jgi:regulatory protein